MSCFRFPLAIFIGTALLGYGAVRAADPGQGENNNPKQDPPPAVEKAAPAAQPTPIYLLSDFMGYNRISTIKGKEEVTEIYKPTPGKPQAPNYTRTAVKDGKETSRSTRVLSGFTDQAEPGEERGELSCLTALSYVPGPEPVKGFEAVTLTFFRNPAIRLPKPVQFNFFEYTGYDRLLERSKDPETVTFADNERYRIGNTDLLLKRDKIARLDQALKAASKDGGAPGKIDYRILLLAGPVPAKIPSPVLTGKPFYFRDMAQVKLHAELPLGRSFPGLPFDPEVAWTAEAVEGGEYFNVLIDDIDSAAGTSGPAATVTQTNKSSMVRIRLEAKKAPAPGQNLKVKVSAKLLVAQDSGKLEEALGSFEMVFTCVQ